MTKVEKDGKDKSKRDKEKSRKSHAKPPTKVSCFANI